MKTRILNVTIFLLLGFMAIGAHAQDPVWWTGGEINYIFDEPRDLGGGSQPPLLDQGILTMCWNDNLGDDDDYFIAVSKPDDANQTFAYLFYNFNGAIVAKRCLDRASSNCESPYPNTPPLRSLSGLGDGVRNEGVGYMYNGFAIAQADQTGNQLFKRHRTGDPDGVWENYWTKNDLFPGLQDCTITAMARKELVHAQGFRYYRYLAFLRNGDHSLSVCEFDHDDSLMGPNVPDLDLVSVAYPEVSFPFLTIAASQNAEVLSYTISPDLEIAVTGRPDSTPEDQIVYYRGRPRLMQTTNTLNLNSRKVKPGFETQAQDTAILQIQICPKTDPELQTWEDPVGMLLYDDKYPDHSHYEISCLETHPSVWEVIYLMPAPATNSYFPDYTDEFQVACSIATLPNGVALRISCNSLLNIDDPKTANGLEIINIGTPATPIQGIDYDEIMHPFAKYPLSSNKTFAIRWPHLDKFLTTPTETPPTIELEFYKYEYIDGVDSFKPLPFSPIRLAAPFPRKYLWSCSSEDFNRRFPGPERYYIRAKLTLSPPLHPTKVIIYSNGGIDRPWDWFDVNEDFTGLVFRPDIDHRFGQMGPWATSHHHMWAEGPANKMVLAENPNGEKNLYVVYYQRQDDLATWAWDQNRKDGLAKFTFDSQSEHYTFSGFISCPIDSENFEMSAFEGPIKNYNILNIVYNEAVQRIFACIVTREYLDNAFNYNHAYLVEYDLGQGDWVRYPPGHIYNGKIIIDRIDKGAMFKLWPSDYTDHENEGVYQAPGMVLTCDDRGRPFGCFLAWHNGLYDMTAEVPINVQECFNMGFYLDDHGINRFVFKSVDREKDKYWACHQRGLIPQVAASGRGLNTAIHFFGANSSGEPGVAHYWASQQMLKNLYFGIVAPRNPWTLTGPVFPNLENSFIAHFDDLGLDLQTEFHLGDAKRITSGQSYVLATQDELGSSAELHVIALAHYGAALTTYQVLYNHLAFDIRNPPESWPVCQPGNFSDYVIHDSFFAPPFDIHHPNWPRSCNIQRDLLPDCVNRPYLSVDDSDPSGVRLLAVWDHNHYHQNLCEPLSYNTVFNKSYKVGYKFLEPGGSWSPGTDSNIYNKNSSMGSRFPIVLTSQEQPNMLVYTDGENYEYRPPVNHDFNQPERFNFNFYGLYHGLMINPDLSY